MSDKWIVFVENGYTNLLSPNGEFLGWESEGILKNPVKTGDGNDNSTYQATFIVDVVSDKKEALELLEKRKKEKASKLLGMKL